MRDDKETKTTLRVNKIETQREVTVQDVRVKGQSGEPDELSHAAEESVQSP